LSSAIIDVLEIKSGLLDVRLLLEL